jgi:hypothetical protein
LKNKIASLLLLNLLITFLYTVLVVDCSKNFPLFESQKVITASSSTVKTVINLEPNYYLLRIKHKLQKEEGEQVLFNDKTITPFNKTLRPNSDKEFFFETDYFLIQSAQSSMDNSLKINFTSSSPREVTLRLQNYRQTFFENNVIIFFRPTFTKLVEFRPLQSAVVFLVISFFSATIFLHFEEKGQRILLQTTLKLTLLLMLAALFNVLPFTQYVFFISPGYFLGIWALTAVLIPIILRNNLLPCFAKDTCDDEPQVSNTRRFVLPIFFVLLLSLLALRLVLILDKRVPAGHDTFQYLQFQYLLFFNEPALHGTVPQWLPFLTQGSVSNFWVIFCQGILTSGLVPVAGFFKNINFYYLFQAGLLFDEMILLFGCVMLAKRYLKSAAGIIFVTSSIIFTTISSTQIWWDFHLIYLFPVTLYCFDRALREVSAKYLFLAGLFSVGMLLGNPPYCLPLFGFTMVVFGLTVLGFFPAQSLACLKKFAVNLKLRHLPAVVIPCVLFVIILLFLKHGTENMTPFNANRTSNWQISGVRDILTYGPCINLTKYIEFISRGTNNLDNTVYAGLLLTPFILFTLLKVRSRISYAFGSTAIIMALFSAGIIVPIVFYYAFPFAKYYRHIGLIAPLVKFFAVFYAGFGFDELWQILNRLNKKYSDRCFAELKLCLFPLITMMLLILTAVSLQYMGGLTIFNYPLFGLNAENQLYSSREQISGLMAVLMMISGLFSLLLTAMLWCPRKAVYLGWGLILLHLADVGSLKAESEIKRLAHVDKDVVSLFDVCDYSFSNNRSQDYFSNPRFSRIIPYLFRDDIRSLDLNLPVEWFGKYGMQYWNIDTFLFFDPVSHIFSTQRWEKGVSDFYKVWTPESDGIPRHAGFPLPQTPAFNNLCGRNSPKLQLFSRIHTLPGEKDVAEMLANPSFQGDMLLTSNTDSTPPDTRNALVTDSKVIDLADSNERIDNAGIIVRAFSFDTLRLQVNNETKNDAVLYYADAWHPEWHASVNGKCGYVFKTNLAYKSVIVPPGRSDVVFQFGDAVSKFLFNGMIAIGIVVFFGLSYCMATGLSEKDKKLSSERTG